MSLNNITLALSPLTYKFESYSWRGVLDTTLCDKVCQWFLAVILHQWNWQPRYNGNMVEMCVKRHTPYHHHHFSHQYTIHSVYVTLNKMFRTISLCILFNVLHTHDLHWQVQFSNILNNLTNGLTYFIISNNFYCYICKLQCSLTIRLF